MRVLRTCAAVALSVVVLVGPFLRHFEPISVWIGTAFLGDDNVGRPSSSTPSPPPFSSLVSSALSSTPSRALYPSAAELKWPAPRALSASPGRVPSSARHLGKDRRHGAGGWKTRVNCEAPSTVRIFVYNLTGAFEDPFQTRSQNIRKTRLGSEQQKFV